MKPPRATTWASVPWLLLLAMVCHPAAAAPPGEQLIDKVTQAYQDVQQYDATLRFQMRQSEGRWNNIREAEFYIVLDRPANRLLIDSPDQRLVIDGTTLLFKSPQLPGKHLAVPLNADNPLDATWILQQAPPLIYPSLPTDFAFLLADDPIAYISQDASGKPITLPPAEDDPDKRPRIQGALQNALMTLTINPTTYLIDHAIIEFDTAAMGAPAGTEMSYRFDFDVHATDQPIDDDRFAFDTAGSIASPSMQHMMASGSNAPHPLTGQPVPELILPDIDGKDHDIATDDAKVIVLDFWATWCPPCVAALPELQEVYDWTQADGGKSVAIYAVNQGETVEEVKAFWAENSLTLPVLMDENFTAAQAYQVSGIPQTVIIANGKVHAVHVGYREGFGEQMKAEIEALLVETE